jgi:hypothetical protein
MKYPISILIITLTTLSLSITAQAADVNTEHCDSGAGKVVCGTMAGTLVGLGLGTVAGMAAEGAFIGLVARRTAAPVNATRVKQIAGGTAIAGGALGAGIASAQAADAAEQEDLQVIETEQAQ